MGEGEEMSSPTQSHARNPLDLRVGESHHEALRAWAFGIVAPQEGALGRGAGREGRDDGNAVPLAGTPGAFGRVSTCAVLPQGGD